MKPPVDMPPIRSSEDPPTAAEAAALLALASPADEMGNVTVGVTVVVRAANEAETEEAEASESTEREEALCAATEATEAADITDAAERDASAAGLSEEVELEVAFRDADGVAGPYRSSTRRGVSFSSAVWSHKRGQDAQQC